MSYIPVKLQRQDPTTEEWADVKTLHATKVNRTGGGESFGAGADQYHPRLTFEFRWCRLLEELRFNTQQHRLVYRGHTFNIKDYDDFMERHLTVWLVGEAYE